MMLFDEVAVVTDARTAEEANVIRAWLESLRLRVHFYRLTRTRQVWDFFENEASKHAWTVLATHGTGAEIQFRVVHQEDEQWDAVDGWAERNIDLTPNLIMTKVKGSGALLTLACGGGRPELAEAFLSAGYDAYVGMETLSADTDAGLLFILGVFHFLRAEDRDLAPTHYDLVAAVEKARKFDEWERGTSAYRCYTRG